MKTFKIIFESGATEIIEADAIERNDVLDNVKVKDDSGTVMEEYYLNLEHISAIIPQG